MCRVPLSPLALKVYATVRSHADKSGRTRGFSHEVLGAAAGMTGRHFRRGLREAEEAGVVTTVHLNRRNVQYTFPKVGSKWQDIPNVTLRAATKSLQPQEFAVFNHLYQVPSVGIYGLTYATPSSIADDLDMTSSNVSRALRKIQREGLAMRCTDSCNGSKSRKHWHLDTRTVPLVSAIEDALVADTGDSERVLYVRKEVPAVESYMSAPMKDHYITLGSRKDEEKVRCAHEEGNDMGNVTWDAVGMAEEPTPKKQPLVTLHHPERAVDPKGIAELYADWMSEVFPKEYVSWKDKTAINRWAKDRLRSEWTIEQIRRAVTLYFKRQANNPTLTQGTHIVKFMAWAKANATEITTPRLSLKEQADIANQRSTR